MEGKLKRKKPVVFIKTFGCQMNTYDTEVAGGLLEQAGYEIVEDDFTSGWQDKKKPGADLILMNTCSVREHAEERVYGRLGMLGRIKQDFPELIIGLMGCMVEEHKTDLFRRFPQIDLLVGTRNISDLPGLVEEVRRERRQVARIRQEGLSIEYTDQIRRSGDCHAWLPIMTGCNKVCTFCIVPVTRGPEVSMQARSVYREAERLAGDGVKWITLLGQNVNSYRGGESGRETGFPELLERLCEIKGLQRISFTTSHPQDATPELFDVIARNPKISRRFHLPLQSGSDRMLKRMKRLHTYEEYLEKILRLRETVPGVVLTTDIIAAFSGETAEDHALTLRALEGIRFDSAFIYKYSVRPGTPASRLPDDVPREEKERRNQELLELQKKISHEINEARIGSVVSVFAEGRSSKDADCLVGRTDQEYKVVFRGNASEGQFVKVKLASLRHDTFRGERVQDGQAQAACP